MPNFTVISKKASAETDVTYTINTGDVSTDGRLKDLEDLATGTVTMIISPATKVDFVAATTTQATTYNVTVTLKAGTNVLEFGNYTLAASVADTVTATTATINDTTPTMVNGVATITVTLPAGAYVADETVTVTISNLTLPDGRTVTGGTSVLTVAAAE